MIRSFSNFVIFFFVLICLTQQRLAAGDVAGARSASGAARSLGIAAMGFGLVAIIIVIILFATGAFIASTYYPYYDPYYG